MSEKLLRGRYFSSRNEVMEKTKMALTSISNTKYESQDWMLRGVSEIAVDGNYFDEDNNLIL